MLAIRDTHYAPVTQQFRKSLLMFYDFKSRRHVMLALRHQILVFRMLKVLRDFF